MLAGTGEKVQASTTTAFTRLLRKLLRDPDIGSRIVPIIPDEARTFGLDALFREFKIYAPFGQRYEPVDAELLLSYREASNGRILEEGITEAGSMASFTAAGTSYATWGQPMIPFFIFYSMFGFQRVGDLIWAFGDQRGRGFLLGATAGRTTLTGEGLQHCDGQSQLLGVGVPELPRRTTPRSRTRWRVIIRDGIERMYGPEPEDCFYYLTLYNENYPMPAMPEGVEDGIVRGLYRYRAAPAVDNGAHRAQILASGTAMLAALEAQQLLAETTTSPPTCGARPATSCCARTRSSTERWNRLHPTEPPRTPYVTEQLGATRGPGRRGDRLHEGRPRPDRALRAAAVRPARHRRLRLLRHPARAAPPLRGRRPRSWSRRSTAWRSTGDIKGEVVAEAIRATRSTPTRRPPPHLTARPSRTSVASPPPTVAECQMLRGIRIDSF